MQLKKFSRYNTLSFYPLFLLNSIIVFLLAFPNLENPPRSDHWTMFYYFSKIKSITESGMLNQIATYSLFEKVPRFQPLANIILYFTFSIFKDHIILYNLFNTSVYILFIFFVYKLSSKMSNNSFFIFLIVTPFSVLVTHFDIVCWSYHSYIIIGIIFLISGFLSLYNYLNSGGLFKLFLFVFFSSLGILCYESFILWPLSFLFLLNKYKQSSKSLKLIFVSVVLLYFVCGILFIKFIFPDLNYNYIKNIYHAGRRMLTFSSFAIATDYTLINIFFVNIIINSFPSLIFPLNIFQNVEFDGIFLDKITDYFSSGPIYFIFVWITFIFLGIFLWRQKKKKNSVFVIIFLLNMFSSLFMLLIVRDKFYVLAQPRYQFIANFNLCILLICLLDEPFNKSSRFLKLFFIIFAFYIFSFHSFYTYKTIKRITKELEPLKIMFTNIHIAIENKIIQKDSTLYIPPEIVDSFPGLCWSHDMDSYIAYGRYEYLFKDKLDYFSFSEEKAKYKIDKETLKVLAIKP